MSNESLRARRDSPRRFALILLVFAVGALFAGGAALAIGDEPLALGAAIGEWFRLRLGAAPNEALLVDVTILELRLARVAVAFAVGAGLAVCGTVFQALLRNPLATPYTLGVASGGALGAYLGFLLFAGGGAWGAFAWIGPGLAKQSLSLVGSGSVAVAIYLLARARRGVSTIGLLLAGVTLSLICSAGMMLARYLSTPDKLMQMERWLMGGVDVGSFAEVAPMFPLLLIGVATLLWRARDYNHLVFGDELAAGRGVDVARLRLWTFAAGSAATASIVAMAGPVGFVGLIVPHALRHLVGPDHRLLLPCALLGGGAFLVFCDTVARSIINGVEIPVGVLTASLGGPFFLVLLIRSQRKGWDWR